MALARIRGHWPVGPVRRAGIAPDIQSGAGLLKSQLAPNSSVVGEAAPLFTLVTGQGRPVVLVFVAPGTPVAPPLRVLAQARPTAAGRVAWLGVNTDPTLTVTQALAARIGASRRLECVWRERLGGGAASGVHRRRLRPGPARTRAVCAGAEPDEGIACDDQRGRAVDCAVPAHPCGPQ